MFEVLAGISLDTLRVFESAARHLSFTAAAAELGSTQPAISQQIKRLEAQLAARLFDRVYRGIVLTDAGEALLVPVQEGLAAIDAGLATVVGRQQHEVLQVATDFAFAAYWLMPRLQRFHQRYPDVDVSLITSERDLASLPAEIDVAISFGDGRFKHGEQHLLFSEEVFAVCSPLLLKDLETSGEPLAQLPLLHLRPESRSRWFDWSGLFRALGIAEMPSPGSLRFDNYTLLIQAAIAGRGVAIGWRHLVDELIDQGLLVRLDARSATSRFGYYVVLPARKRRIRLVEHFVAWLQDELQREPLPDRPGGIDPKGLAL
ncbi:LysR family transcriptional regulator [Pseudomonas sp. URMO17WK12:I4]|uniref:choline sulfate utilization transcriptional regulator n=1 Tax=Pseudomonas sp. URMO17WK12:I4 TaxID=1283292 RepID=UPI000489C13E|nr:LysR family transcriptional regulator [Pseudomonas sp. URMO17WK12:I4]